jgi:hypothetical protein
VDDGDARVVARVVWHQTRPRNALLDIAGPADHDGRRYRAGQAGAWCASSSERGAWG